jgi:hypothetical protein
MKRRDFIVLVGGAAAAWPLPSLAQEQGKLPTVVYVGGTEAGPDGKWFASFVERFRELGWVESRTVAIERQWSDGRAERVAEIAAELVRRKVDVIVTYGAAVTTVKWVTASIPVVFAVAVDSLGGGLVANLSHPGGSRVCLCRPLRLPASACSFCQALADWQFCLTQTILQVRPKLTMFTLRPTNWDFVLSRLEFDWRRCTVSWRRLAAIRRLNTNKKRNQRSGTNSDRCQIIVIK